MKTLEERRRETDKLMAFAGAARRSDAEPTDLDSPKTEATDVGDKINRRLRELPDDKHEEVLQFIEFLIHKADGKQRLQRVREIMERCRERNAHRTDEEISRSIDEAVEEVRARERERLQRRANEQSEPC